MRVVGSELATVAFFVVTGWLALWPARRRLGRFGYHIAALPTGLLSTVVAGATASLVGRPLDVWSACLGAALFVAVMRALLRMSGEAERAAAPFDPRSFLIAGGTIAALATVVGFARLTDSNNDSIVSYWPLGMWLHRTGEIKAGLMASRGVLLPAMNAIHISFRSDWAYVIYPMLAATMLGWVAFSLAVGPLGAASRRTALVVAGGATAALALEPSFIFHSLFVHSHMVSGLYLFMALTCLWLGLPPRAAEKPGAGSKQANLAYLVLAGAFTAGLAHARPDGLAYQFVPVVAAVSVLTLGRVDRQQVLAYFAPLLVLVAGVYAAVFARIGVWESAKLSGKTALAIIVVLGVSAAGPWIVQSVGRLTGWRVTGERFYGVVVAVAAIGVAGLLLARWDTAGDGLRTARINLFQGAGGYHYLWYAVVALLALSLLTGDALRPRSWTRPAFLSIALFFVVAAAVHGLSHEGRIGVGDSFNRIAFHVLPVVVWFVAAVVARILVAPQATTEAATAGSTESGPLPAETLQSEALDAEPA